MDNRELRAKLGNSLVAMLHVVEAARAVDKALWNHAGMWVSDAGIDIGMLFSDEMVALREAIDNLDKTDKEKL